MNEVSENIEALTAEILVYKEQTARNIFEIGKRLIKVKEILPHGTWGEWLKVKVDFSEVTAQRFMRCATEFSNTSPATYLVGGCYVRSYNKSNTRNHCCRD